MLYGDGNVAEAVLLEESASQIADSTRASGWPCHTSPAVAYPGAAVNTDTDQDASVVTRLSNLLDAAIELP